MAGRKNEKELLTVKNIRVNNKTSILRQLVKGKDLTRNDLARENHISLMTVKHIVDDLVNSGVVEEHAFEASVGRKPKALNLAEKYGNIVCVNLTSQESIDYIIYDLKRTPLVHNTHVLSRGIDRYMAHLDAVVEEIRDKLSGLSTVTVGVGISVPSAYYASQDLTNYDLIPAFKDLHIRQYFREKFHLENIQVVHDVVSAAKSEYEAKPVRDNSMFYFYCGYGVGGCFMLHGEAVTGEDLLAGEVGKLQIDNPFGEGLIDLEELISIPGIVKHVQQRIPDIQFEDILKQYKEGKEEITGIMDEVFETISRVIYNMTWLINPAKFVIDSFCRDYAELIVEKVQEYLKRFRTEDIYVTTEVEQAVYQEYHDLRGCFRTTLQSWIENLAEED